MRRLLTISALFALALALSATAQPPAQPKNKPADDKKAEKKPDPTDAAIAAALAHDADVKMAQAKVLLGEAELAKARQAVTLRVVTLKGRIEQLKADVRSAQDRAAWSARMADKGAATQAQVAADRDKLEAAKAALALAEAEWKLLTGARPSAAGVIELHDDKAAAAALEWFRSRTSAGDSDAAALLALAAGRAARERAAVKGPVAEGIRAALDKPVKFPKGQVDLNQAMEAFRNAGLDAPIRGLPLLHDFDSYGEELPIGAWLQLYQDAGEGVFYVREYGLLYADKKSAPPDAPTLTQFWKQKPAAKEPKAESKTETKR